jgi:TolB-like protein
MQLSALTSALGRFVSELQRRKVIRVAAGYAVVGWIVLQVALALQTALKLPDSFSTGVVSLLIIGFPVVLVLAWLFEFAPEGIKRTAAGGEGALVEPKTTDLILAGMLALVLVVALAQALAPREVAPAATTNTARTEEPKVAIPAPGDKSIAVLPFANLSPDKKDEYFADGLTEEILHLLAKSGDLKVISRTSSFAFKSKNTPMPEIAKQLGVRHVVEGSVRASDRELRITAQLIDVSTDTHLWSETYERTIEDVFALQDEIARDIAGALKVEVTLASSAKSPTPNIEAYRLYLQARALHARRGKGDLQQGVELYKRAIALDPNFADAHAALATNYAAMANQLGGPAHALRSLARQSAEAALKLNPRVGRVHAALGVLARQALNWEAAKESYEVAIAEDPSDSIALSSLSTMLTMLGEFERANQVREQAMRLDPLYGHILAPGRLAYAIVTRDDRTATTLATKLLTTNDERRVFAFATLIFIERERGAVTEAERVLREFAKALSTKDPIVDSMARALRSRSAFGEVASAARELAAKDARFEPEGVFAVIGDHDRFFDALEARMARQDTASFSRWTPWIWRFATAGRDASFRFKKFARLAGMVDYWKKNGWPDRCRAKGEDDFECS